MRDEFKTAYANAMDLLEQARAALDTLSDTAMSMDADMHICFAGGSIRGAQSLLREASREEARWNLGRTVTP